MAPCLDGQGSARTPARVRQDGLSTRRIDCPEHVEVAKSDVYRQEILSGVQGQDSDLVSPQLIKSGPHV
jgi:hypothetical protein